MNLNILKRSSSFLPLPHTALEKNKYCLQVHEIEFPPTQTFTQKLKKHWAQYWWIYLFISGVCIVNIILCLIYIIMPSMAQQNVDNSYLLSTDMKLEKPTPHSVSLTQTVLLYTKTEFTPTLRPFIASLYIVNNGTYSTTPMSIVRFPQIHALHPFSSNTLKDVVLDFRSEASMEEVIKFSNLILTQEVVTMAIIGDGKVRLGALPEMSVHYNQTTSFRGLNGLQGFNVTNARLNLKARAGEPNMSGLATMYNPSLLTVEMGNVTFTLATAENGVVGSSSIDNMTLQPGHNKFQMKSFVNQTKVAQSMNATTGIVMVMIRGNSSVYNGQHLPYYEKALAAHQINLPLNIPAVLANSRISKPSNKGYVSSLVSSNSSPSPMNNRL